jgi:hypothetical protein
MKKTFVHRLMHHPLYKIALSVFTVLTLFFATIAVILYAKGYRLEQKGLMQTGQLVLKSNPDAASVFINGRFVSATNSTLNLTPGEYEVKIVKDGYSPWNKKLKIESEVVTPTDAVLFPAVPELRRFTSTGALNPVESLDRMKVAYGVASSSSYPPKNGVYVSDISDQQNVFMTSGTQLVVRDSSETQYSKGNYLFSPDGRQLLIYFYYEIEESIPQVKMGIDLVRVAAAYLVDTTKSVNGEDVPDVSFTLDQILDSWQKEIKTENANQFNILKKDLKKIASSSMEILSFTADESRFVYSAKQNTVIPIIVNPRLVGTNSTPENREIKKGNLYIYDIKEDRNYEVQNSPPKADQPLAENDKNPNENLNLPQWLATSRHYITVEDSKIYVTEYDGTNKTLLFSGPFEKNFVVPTASGNRIIFLTSLSSDLPLNLYALLVR